MYPHPHPHHPQHHKTADELALEEADKLLHTPVTGRGADGDVAELLSPRSERRRRLQEARDRSGTVLTDATDADADEKATDRGSEAAFEGLLVRGGDGTSAGIVETLLGGTSLTSDISAASTTDIGAQGDESSATLRDDREGLDHEAQGESSARSASIAVSDAADSDSDSDSGSESRSGSEDDSDDSSDSSDSSEGDSEADSDESDTDDEEDRLERLLAAAKLSAAQSASDTAKGKGKAAENGHGHEEDLLRLEAESKEA